MAQSGVGDHVTVGDGAFLASRTGAGSDVEPGARVWGFPALQGRAWHRQQVALSKLPDALKRLRALEAREARRIEASSEDSD